MKNKSNQTWTVIQTASESEVQNIGSNFWIKAQKKKILLLVVFALIIGIGLSKLSVTVKACYIGALVLVIAIGIYFMLKAGKRYFESVKDKKVIDLRKKKDESK